MNVTVSNIMYTHVHCHQPAIVFLYIYSVGYIVAMYMYIATMLTITMYNNTHCHQPDVVFLYRILWCYIATMLTMTMYNNTHCHQPDVGAT